MLLHVTMEEHLPDKKRNGSSPPKHCTPITRPSMVFIHFSMSQPNEVARSSKCL